MQLPNYVLRIDLSDFDLGSKVLLFNTVNQVLVELDKEEAKCLFERGCSSEDQFERLFKDLEKVGIFDEPQLESEPFNTSRIVIVPTLRCNKSCSYCYHGGTINLEMKIADIPTLLHYIKNFIKEKKPQKVSVIWHGGEPLLVVNFISRLSNELHRIAFLNDLGYEETLLTNGVLLSEDMAIFIMKNTYIRDIQISIDKETSESSLQKIKLSVKKLLEEGCAITIKYNVQEQNWDRIKQIAQYFSSISNGNLFFILGYLEPHGDLGTWSPMSYSEFIDRYWSLADFFRSLRIGWEPSLPTRLFSACVADDPNSITIGPDLFTYRCNVNIPSSKWRIFGIHDQENGKVNKMAETIFLDYDPFNDPLCKDCPVVYLCMGGCHIKRIFNQRTKEYCKGTVLRVKWQVVDFYKSKVICKNR
ncbi:radical SAM/SPASM domain-containing protein [Thermosulfurimonas dismutans]|uniref:Arylsulfatase regulator (Fe-S oxidoreductase) n=1 Tax=Thermosulfurimonas dismutans TaxID=999894 RepID=A0A179D3F7_9BACT|nr:radical SAM protein [Thermosulfurimonas dismutans]OAQ20610.1 Arylsulfatase regulator (Fe-S oxidoreductase) [Thermosulfurimonas dismutans]